MKITTKMIVGFAFVIAILLLAHLYQTFFAYRVRHVVDSELAERGFGTGLVAFQLLEELKDLEEFSSKYLVLGDSIYRSELAKIESSIDEDLHTLQRVNVTQTEKEELNHIFELWKANRQTIDRTLGVSAETSETEKEELDIRIRTVFSDLRGAVRNLIAAKRTEIGETVSSIHEMAAQVMIMSWISLLVATLLSVFVCILVYRLISHSLEKLIRATEQIASGNFEVRLDESSGDELGEFARHLNQMAGRLAETDQIKRKFISQVSHDLSAPLASMQETTRLLLEEYSNNLDETQKRLLELNLSSSGRLSKLVDDLLDLTTIQAGVMRFDFENVELCELVQAAVKDHYGLLRKRELTIDLRLPETGPIVSADRLRLSQLLGNVLANAIKYSPQGGSVIVEVEETGASGRKRHNRANHVCVSITDEGPGIPDEAKEQIFKEFHRTVSKQSDQKDGTGLGLAIAQKIASALGGNIWVEDNPSGKGAKFVFSMPVLS